MATRNEPPARPFHANFRSAIFPLLPQVLRIVFELRHPVHHGVQVRSPARWGASPNERHPPSRVLMSGHQAAFGTPQVQPFRASFGGTSYTSPHPVFMSRIARQKSGPRVVRASCNSAFRKLTCPRPCRHSEMRPGRCQQQTVPPWE